VPKIKIFKHGRHAHRTPLSYPALASLFSDFIEITSTPDQADLYIFAHFLDVAAAPRPLVEDWRRRRRPVILLSEEPFWDTIWGRRPQARRRLIDTDYGPLPVIQLNHHTSRIFHFDRIPYYLLTNHRFANTYAAHFTRNAQRSPAEWQSRFAEREVDLCFMFERRPELFHNVHWAEGDIIGLCAWRTELAERCGAGKIERLGASWQSGPSRFEIDNWYLDKITRLDERTRLMAAFENTHQPDYLTEKIFDAFACGTLPLYYASTRHRIHDFGLPAAAWVNLFGLPPAEAAQRVDAITCPAEVFEAYAQAQQQLKRLFCDPSAWVTERDRLRLALRDELTAVLSDKAA